MGEVSNVTDEQAVCPNCSDVIPNAWEYGMADKIRCGKCDKILAFKRSVVVRYETRVVEGQDRKIGLRRGTTHTRPTKGVPKMAAGSLSKAGKALGKKGGKAHTTAKAKAARKNGTKGGRPSKS